MDYILTLNKINKSDTGIAGFKGVDLAQMFNKKINIPICFVIKSDLFDDFIESNNLKQNLDNILKNIDYSSQDSLTQSHAKISELITNSDFSQEMQNEILEAYETLAIDMDHIDIAKLVTTIEKPFLTVIGSPNYIDDSDNNECVFQNVRRKLNLLKAIKNCWISLYTPRALTYRKKNDIDTKERMAVIVQRMVDAKISIQAKTDETEICINTFFGFQDYNNEFGKDEYIYSKENLSLKNSKIKFQEFQLERDIQSDSLTKKALKNEGEKQKLNDKDVEEIARIIKKIEGIIENPIKIFLNMSKNRIYLLFANRIVKQEEQTDSGLVSKDLNKETIDNSTKKNSDEEIVDDIPTPKEDEKETEEVLILKEDEKKIEQEVPKPTDKENMNTNIKQKISPEKIAETPTNDNGIEIEEVNFDDDVAFLEEIEKFEQESDKEEQASKEEPVIPVEDVQKPDEVVKEVVEEKDEPEEEMIPDKPVDIKKEEPIDKPEETSKEENDDFIFSEFEEKNDEEKPATPVEPEKTTTPNTSELNNIDKAHENIKNIIILSDDAIFQALSKKYEELLNSKPESFESAIEKIKDSVRVPFIDEIKKVHEIRIKIDDGKKFEIEEATIALRTAKNFLTIFSE